MPDPFVTKNMISAIIPATSRMPTHTPALKIPPAIAQLLNVKRKRAWTANERVLVINNFLKAEELQNQIRMDLFLTISMNWFSGNRY